MPSVLVVYVLAHPWLRSDRKSRRYEARTRHDLNERLMIDGYWLFILFLSTHTMFDSPAMLASRVVWHYTAHK